MQKFDYAAPQSIAEATTLLSQTGVHARVLAGGTDLLVQMRENGRSVDLVVNIKRISEAKELSYDPNNGLIIGAAVPCLQIRDDDAVARYYPGLVDAVALIGGIQIQARATIGGNLANASPAADAIPALIVHNATCEIVGPGGTRQVPVEAFCTAPGQTVLQDGEFLIRLLVEPPGVGFGAHYLRFIPRNEMDIAVVGAGASVILEEDGHTIKSGRIALGAVAPTPLFAQEASDFLAGKTISDDVVQQAAKLAADATNPITDLRGTARQRKHLAGVLTRRALHKAIERAQLNLRGEA